MKSLPNGWWALFRPPPAGFCRSRTYRSPPRDFQHFSPDDKSLLYGETHDSVTNLWKKPVTGGEGTQFTHFRSEQIFNSVITPDGKLVMGRGHIQSDAILIRTFR